MNRLAIVGSTLVLALSASMAYAGGESTYNSKCATCHASGVAGAPKVGDAAAWKDRIGQGKDTLYKHAINGFKAMPPKGGFGSLSDDEVKATVDYMVSKSK